MQDAPSFVVSYTEAERPQIVFAWNGKYASEFADLNQSFRWSVVEHCLAEPDAASPLLLAHLFLADADWSQEAWGAPHHFAELGALLLQRGSASALDSFSTGFVRSFDTFGACHSISLSPQMLEGLSAAVEVEVTKCSEESQERLIATRELFGKLAQGTGSEGWATVAAGTPVSNVRVVWPRWYHRLWAKLTGGSGAT